MDVTEPVFRLVVASLGFCGRKRRYDLIVVHETLVPVGRFTAMLSA